MGGIRTSTAKNAPPLSAGLASTMTSSILSGNTVQEMCYEALRYDR